MADVAAFEREGRAQREVIRPDGAGFVAGGQLEGQFVPGLDQQGMLHVAGEAVLAAGVDFAVLRLEMAARQLACIGKENRRVAVPDGGISAPDHFAAGGPIDGADHFRAEGIDGQADELVFDGISHKNSLWGAAPNPGREHVPCTLSSLRGGLNRQEIHESQSDS